MSAQLRNWFFTVTATATAVGRRFLTNDEPNQATFQNLCDSVPFKLESSDKAGTTAQGLVRLVSDANAKSRTLPDSTWSYVPTVDQLPWLGNLSQTIPLTNSVPAYNDAVIDNPVDGAVTDSNKYTPSLKSTFITWLTTNVLSRLIPSGGSSGQVLSKSSGTDFAVGWTSATSLPTGGSTGQVLKKNSGTDYDVVFGDQYPSFTGNSLKTLRVNAGETAVEWAASAASTNVPTGGIIMYDGSFANFDGTGMGINTLIGWALCNGGNGTPDLSGKFIVSYSAADSDFNAIGDAGGAKTHTLIEANLPPHTHSGTTSSSGVSLSIPQLAADNDRGSDPSAFSIDGVDVASTAHTHTFTTGNGNGTSTAVNHMPPYYTLAYIKKIS